MLYFGCNNKFIVISHICTTRISPNHEILACNITIHTYIHTYVRTYNVLLVKFLIELHKDPWEVRILQCIIACTFK